MYHYLYPNTRISHHVTDEHQSEPIKVSELEPVT